MFPGLAPSFPPSVVTFPVAFTVPAVPFPPTVPAVAVLFAASVVLSPPPTVSFAPVAGGGGGTVTATPVAGGAAAAGAAAAAGSKGGAGLPWQAPMRTIRASPLADILLTKGTALISAFILPKELCDVCQVINGEQMTRTSA